MMGPRLRAVLTPMSPRLLHLLAAQGLRAWAWAVAEAVKGVGGLEIREHQGKVSRTGVLQVRGHTPGVGSEVRALQGWGRCQRPHGGVTELGGA